jgi:DNA replication protein DnaC
LSPGWRTPEILVGGQVISRRGYVKWISRLVGCWLLTTAADLTGETVTKSDREIMEILESYDLTRCAYSAARLAGCDAATRRMRRKTANFPAGKTFATWRPDESSIPAPTQQALSTLEWIGRAENLAVAGPSGTGKSHFVEALAHHAIEADLRVAWFTLETLATTIGRAKADASIARRRPRLPRTASGRCFTTPSATPSS